MTYNKRIKELRRAIAKLQTEKEKVKKLVSSSIKKWTGEYAKYTASAEDLADLKVYGTKKEEMLKKRIKGWKSLGTGLTATRDMHRAKLREIEQELIELGLELAQLEAKQSGEVNAIDEIVNQVFGLNEVAVRASNDRTDCLKRHVFPRLFGEDGKLLSQVTFTSTDGLRRVTAMVNTMTIVEGDLANQAQTKIEEFFEKFRSTSMDKVTEAMFELTKQILVEKTKFKVGPYLYQFLGMDLDEKIFPELSLAQKYLRQSIRCEKTNSYIRIYKRSTTADNWSVVPQS